MWGLLSLCSAAACQAADSTANGKGRACTVLGRCVCVTASIWTTSLLGSKQIGYGLCPSLNVGLDLQIGEGATVVCRKHRPVFVA